MSDLHPTYEACDDVGFLFLPPITIEEENGTIRYVNNKVYFFSQSGERELSGPDLTLAKKHMTTSKYVTF